jgi:hypothetical protein
MTQKILQDKYAGFRFPDCFFEFQDVVAQLQQAHSININKCALQIKLGDVFRVFEPGINIAAFHPWEVSRYPNDPPEFFTLIHGASDGLHWGYYLEDENSPELFVASYYHRDPLLFTVNGLNLHQMVREQLEKCYRDNEEYLKIYTDDIYKKELDELNQIREVLKKYDTAERTETGVNYLEKYGYKRQTTIPTRDNIGISLPIQQYQPLHNAALWMQPGFSPTPEQVKQCQQQAIELLKAGYPATILKLGHDLWCYEPYRNEAITVLEKAYQALERPRALFFLNKIKALV